MENKTYTYNLQEVLPVKVVVDNYDYPHRITRELGRGGQGNTYRTTTENIIVKIELTDKNEVKDDSRNDRYNNLRLMPLFPNTHITLPQATLKGVAGYVMRFLNQMVSFGEAFEGEILLKEPSCFIQQAGEVWGPIFSQYIATGGARRRLEAYLKAAATLAKLHAAGFIYQDFSPNNVFVSTDTDYCNVWLIDADNLKPENPHSEFYILTEGYAAPEVEKLLYFPKDVPPVAPQELEAAPNSFASDAYTFCICLFTHLFMHNPFEGDNYDNEDLEQYEKDQKLYLGGYSYILEDEDTVEEDNYYSSPFQEMVSSELLDIFQRMFSYNGRFFPEFRPTMFEIVEAIAKNLDKIVSCRHCSMEYSYKEERIDEGTSCPWCGKQIAPAIVKITAHSYDDNKIGHELWTCVHELADSEYSLPARLIHGFRFDELDDHCITVKCLNNTLQLRTTKNEYLFEYEQNQLMGSSGSLDKPLEAFSVVFNDMINHKRVLLEFSFDK